MSTALCEAPAAGPPSTRPSAPVAAPGESRIVVLLLSPSFVVVTRLRAAIGGECEVLCATSLAHARMHFTTRRIAAALLESEDMSGAPTAPLVREMRALHAALPVVAIVRRAAGFTAATMALVGAQPTAVVLAEELDVVSLLLSLVPRFRASELVAGMASAHEMERAYELRCDAVNLRP